MAKAADLDNFNKQLRIIEAANKRETPRMLLFCNEDFYTISLWVDDLLYTPRMIAWPETTNVDI